MYSICTWERQHIPRHQQIWSNGQQTITSMLHQTIASKDPTRKVLSTCSLQHCRRKETLIRRYIIAVRNVWITKNTAELCFSTRELYIPLSVAFRPTLKLSQTSWQSTPLNTPAIQLHSSYFHNIHTCSHKINAVLHCLTNCIASLFPCFAVALCCKFTTVCEGGSVESIGKSDAVVLRRCASCKSVVAGRSAQGPL